MTDPFTPDLWIKLALSVLCGAAIGLERELSDKPAGLRTNMLICVGSTLITMTSLHVALSYAERQVNIADPGRIAAQIVSGVGFLGAGTIIQARGSVQGLTTAATIWVMAGIGMAVGTGMYLGAVVTTAVLLVVLWLLAVLERRIERPRRTVLFSISARRDPGVLAALRRFADERSVPLEELAIGSRDERLRISFASRLSPATRDALVDALLDVPGIEEVRVG